MTAEACSVCHAAGQLAAADTLHDAIAVPALAKGSVEVLSADFTPAAGVVKPVVTFRYLDRAGAPVANWGAFQLTVAQLIPAAGEVPEHWQNRIFAAAPNFWPSSDTGGSGRSGTAGTSKGTLAFDAGTNIYTYTFWQDVVTPAAAAVTAKTPPAWDPALTTRVGVQITNYNFPTGVVTPAFDMANGVADFVPATATTPLATPLAREIITTAGCNACHGKLTLHGRRVEVNYCVTCHNLSSVEVATGLSIDFTKFIHQIHGRDKLSSPTTPIFFGIIPAEKTYPQNIVNCATCHKGAAGARWNTNPSKYACTACHDGISFEAVVPAGKVAHTGGIPPTADVSDANCVTCHTPAIIVAQHSLPAEAEALKIRPVIDTVTVDATTLVPSVRFRIVDPTTPGGCTPATVSGAGACTPYALTNAYFTQTGGASSLSVLIGYANADFKNTGAGTYGQPININLLTLPTGATLTGPDAADGSYTVVSAVGFPAGTTGQGTAAIQGHPAFDPDGAGALPVLRIPMPNVSKAFAITGTAATARRTVVSIAKCNVCHQNLSLHGNNRTGDITTCTICHNTEATDGSVRPTDGTATLDGKSSEGIDFKYMIHSIHGTALGKGIVVYGRGNTPTDFRAVTYPQVPSNCLACHNAGTYIQPAATALGTSTAAGADLALGTDNLRLTRYRATCGACHGTPTQQSHIYQNGGAADVTQAQIDTVNQ